MIEIADDRITKVDGKFAVTCSCGKTTTFSSKSGALNVLKRGSCKYCKKDYRSVNDAEFSIYKNFDGKWCSTCSGCSTEQAYTRKDHAKQSSVNDWQCKSCTAKDKKYSNNRRVGDNQRYFNKLKKSAENRKITWEITLDEMFENFNGSCAMTGWDISLKYSDQTASLDRIDSSKGYVRGNIQWVHTMVNMSKNKFDSTKFIEMCVSIADTYSTKEVVRSGSYT